MNKLRKPLKIFPKQLYLEQELRRRFNDGFELIQVILGPRQIGKTTSIQNILKDYAGPALYVSAEEGVSVNADWLNEVWQQARGKDPGCLLVIDEIQKVPNWSERIKSLWDRQKWEAKGLRKTAKLKVVLLGSSSIKIQEGLSESLSGRFELIRAFHWTWQESRRLLKIASTMTLEEYLVFGGYPGAYRFLKSKKRFDSYVQDSIINTVIEKDLLTQGRVRNPGLFRQTFQLLRTLPATEISYTKLLGQLHERGNTELIKNYLDLYDGAFLFVQIHKFNMKEFNTRLSSPKIVCMAPALLDPKQKSQPEFLGLCFEALVGADLLRAGLEVYYWREGDFEVDYVIRYKSLIVGIEVKTQKHKSSKSVVEFQKIYPKAKIIYINYGNYLKFSADVEAFLDQFS